MLEGMHRLSHYGNTIRCLTAFHPEAFAMDAAHGALLPLTPVALQSKPKGAEIWTLQPHHTCAMRDRIKCS